jgi:hypothetical protein
LVDLVPGRLALGLLNKRVLVASNRYHMLGLELRQNEKYFKLKLPVMLNLS